MANFFSKNASKGAVNSSFSSKSENKAKEKSHGITSSSSKSGSSSSGGGGSSGYSKSLGALGQNQKQIYEGVKSIKGDTTQIKADTSIIQAQNNVINTKVNKVGTNQTVAYTSGVYSQRNIYLAVGGVASLVTASSVAMTDAIKDLTTVIITVGVLLFIGLGAIGWLVYEKFKELNKKLEDKQNV